MKLAHFTVEHLKALPLRAIVAFAARCARRVEPLAQAPEGDPQGAGRRAAVDAALRMAEAFASGADAPPDESVIAAIDAAREAASDPAGSSAVSAAAQAAHAADSAWHAGFSGREEAKAKTHGGEPAQAGWSAGALTHVTADLAALNAFTAAADAFVSVGYHNEDFVGSALNDYDKLVRLGLGRYPEPGDPIDPSPAGPLGPL